ncbi:ESX-1 secretion-associated protein [Mycolicibacterium sp. HK-90]|uniref:ESX-1 secretion-associated protein n=1 Tax=Mycolicibacterium sp. HK-90 TaxID=3056937 RepID=UPI002659F7A4|nr:ESX-1 secretion-associated protein [Mycolicibacterium sp. HK-90]WKG04255.1 ESX-1 secretion-associated protein [Mycolicibacterium sp. HK-90]
MPDHLRVNTTHVRELADRQAKAAQQVLVALAAAQGVGTSMWANHGVVCGLSNTAVIDAELARAAACASMNTASENLSQKLRTAASRYDQTDARSADKLNNKMHPR